MHAILFLTEIACLVLPIRLRSVKTTADVLGFVLISLAAVYLAYKNATYKGPRWELRESCELNALAKQGKYVSQPKNNSWI